jgi:hypothetical protein
MVSVKRFSVEGAMRDWVCVTLYGAAVQKKPDKGVLEDSWGETSWIKDMGFYSLATWIANRLELALWHRWQEDTFRLKKTPRQVRPPSFLRLAPLLAKTPLPSCSVDTVRLFKMVRACTTP